MCGALASVLAQENLEAIRQIGFRASCKGIHGWLAGGIVEPGEYTPHVGKPGRGFRSQRETCVPSLS